MLMIMVNCAFSWIHKEASKAKGEHDPNFPSSVLLAFLLQTSASCSLQWYARAIVARWLPSAAWRWRRQRFPYMFEFRQGTLLCRVIYYPSLPVSIPIWEPSTHTHTTRTGILLLLAAQALDSDREPTKTLSSFK